MTARAPLEHLFLWLQQRSKSFHEFALSSSAGVGTLGEAELGAIAELVCFKAEAFALEFDTLLHGKSWKHVLCRVPSSSPEEQRKVGACVTTAVIRNKCSFHFRFVVPCFQYPRKMFILLADPPMGKWDMEALQRTRRRAREFLETPDKTMDTTTLKIRNILRPYLQVAAGHGISPVEAYNLLRLIAIAVTGDTQEIEGMNNVAKQVVRQAPKASLGLVTCRTVHRKLLGLGNKNYKSPMVASLLPLPRIEKRSH